jgi:hypothetical protein
MLQSAGTLLGVTVTALVGHIAGSESNLRAEHTAGEESPPPTACLSSKLVNARRVSPRTTSFRGADFFIGAR